MSQNDTKEYVVCLLDWSLSKCPEEICDVLA